MAERQLTDEAEAFYIAVYETVQRIPIGRVTTYGIFRSLSFITDLTIVRTNILLRSYSQID